MDQWLVCSQCRAVIEAIDSRLAVRCEDCGASAIEPSNARDFERFRLLDRVGGGSFGEVWSAYDPDADEIVAVKLCWNVGDEAQARSIAHEAQTAMQLSHPNICRVREIGRASDRVFIVSDFVRGQTLDVWRKRRRPSPMESLRLIERLAAVLQYAHDQNVVHRDLKPSNIMVNRAGEPVLLDFGLARDGSNAAAEAIERYQVIRHELRKTRRREKQSSNYLGTPLYMSPEQARGQAHEVDGRSDIYSLGVIFYELLTGRRPYEGHTEKLIRQILRGRPKRPRRLNPKVTKDMQLICLTAMAVEQERRYQTAQAMAEDCEHALSGKSVAARFGLGLATSWPFLVRRSVPVPSP